MKQCIFSFSSSDGHSITSVNLNKKRKLHNESGLEISSPKQRFRVGTNICGQGLVIRGGFSEQQIVREVQNDLNQPEESEMDSNTLTGDYDNSMSSDAKDYNENSITLTIPQSQPSNSLNSYSNDKTHLYSLESRCMKEVNNVEIADLKGKLKFGPGYKAMEDMHCGFGLDHSFSELVSEADAETESMILHSNDVPPHSFVLSSGRWNLGEGTSLFSLEKKK